MDYHLRQLRHAAITNNTLQSWQAYCRALERTQPSGAPGPRQRSIVCYDIQWDIDESDGMGDYGLPSVVVFHASDEDFLDGADAWHEDITEELANELSDKFGFTLHSFDYRVTDCIDLD